MLYEIIDPQIIGGKLPELFLSARSGRAALKDRLNSMKIDFPAEHFENIYHRFLVLADQKRFIEDKDLRSLV